MEQALAAGQGGGGGVDAVQQIKSEKSNRINPNPIKQNMSQIKLDQNQTRSNRIGSSCIKQDKIRPNTT